MLLIRILAIIYVFFHVVKRLLDNYFPSLYKSIRQSREVLFPRIHPYLLYSHSPHSPHLPHSSQPFTSFIQIHFISPLVTPPTTFFIAFSALFFVSAEISYIIVFVIQKLLNFDP